MIQESAAVSLGYAERLLSGVRASDFARLARSGDELVQSNHPAFIYGHLSLYAPRILEQLGDDPGDLRPSDRFVQRFNKDVRCEDDPDGTVYPPMDEITERFFSGYRRAIAALASVDDARFAEPNPNEAMRGKFSTMGSMHAFYLSGHIMIHMGQLSAWRRMMGLGPA